MKMHEQEQKQLKIQQPDMLKSEFDNMEESLRDALRQSNRPAPSKDDANRQIPLSKNTITKHYNYMTVYDHDHAGNFKSSRKPESLQPHIVNHSLAIGAAGPSYEMNQRGNLTAEEFRNYCAFLTDRINKMEEQNGRLLRLAEKQKAEYNKVVSIVAQSEQSQRRLQNECFYLKRQVQQLTTHNHLLKEQHMLHSNHNSPSLPNSGDFRSNFNGFFRDDYGKYGSSENKQSSFEYLRNLHGAIDHIQQQNGSSDERLRKYSASDISGIIELYAALQKSTLSDLGVGEAQSKNLRNSYEPNEQQPLPALKVIPEQSEKMFQSESHSDYASPSSLCATKFCPCTPRSPHIAKHMQHESNDDDKEQNSLTSQRGNMQQAEFSPIELVSQPFASQDYDEQQSFDNNSYIEVELKHYRNQEAYPNSSSCNGEQIDCFPSQLIHRNSKMRRSHNDYTSGFRKAMKPYRPSSLVLDSDSEQGLSTSNFHPHMFQPVSPAIIVHSPLSSHENSDVFFSGNIKTNHNNNNSNYESVQSSCSLETNGSFIRQDNSNATKEKNDLKRSSSKMGPSRKTYSTSVLPEARHGSLNNVNSSKASKTFYSRSASTSDLPPPPPPPPQILEEENASLQLKSITRLKPNNSRLHGSENTSKVSSLDCKGNKEKSEEEEEQRPKFNEGFPRKLSVWKQRTDENPSDQQLSNDQEKPYGGSKVGWRRGSYAAACRKSQSLDHLYELVLLENEKARQEKKDETSTENETSETTTFNALQIHRKSNTTPQNDISTAENFEKNFASSSSLLERENEQISAPYVQRASRKTSNKTSQYEIMMPLTYTEAPKQQQKSREIKSVKNIQSSSQIPVKPGNVNRTYKNNNNSEKDINQKIKKRHVGKVPDFELDFERNPTIVDDDVITDDNVFESAPAVEPRRRHLSEGSSGHSWKTKLENDPNSQLRRHRSVGSERISNKQKGSAIARHTSESYNSPDKYSQSPSQDNFHILRFPSTNPHMRIQPPAVKVRRQLSQDCDERIIETGLKYGLPGSRAVGQSSPSRGGNMSASQNSVKQSEIYKNGKLSQRGTPSSSLTTSKSSIADGPQQQQNRIESKFSKKTKENVASGSSSKKKGSSGTGGNSTRSFVNIMKSKFSRSSSAAKKAVVTAEATRSPDPFEMSLIKPANTFIDPRTLSLEPNVYLSTKKGSTSNVKKNFKHKLGKESDAAVGRKLSQPFPNGINLTSKIQSQLQLVEEVVSDEGFAESSTIERSDKETAASAIGVLPISGAVTSFHFVDETGMEPNTPRPNKLLGTEKKNDAKIAHIDWYDNLVSPHDDANIATDIAKRFQSLKYNPDYNQEPIIDASIQQKHLKNKVKVERPYENFPLELSYQSNNKIIKQATDVAERENLHPASSRREVYATGVTIVRTSPSSLNRENSFITSPRKPISSPKCSNSTQSQALGKIIQSIGSQCSHSKEDLRGKLESGNGKEKTKNMEKAYINSIVQPELSGSLSNRNIVTEPTLKENILCDTPGRLPINSESSNGESVHSIGTGSSFGSLPSDGIGSNHSGDIIEYQGISSSGSSDTPIKRCQRMYKSKRNEVSSFFGLGDQSGKNVGTGDSSTSTSSSEMNNIEESKPVGSNIIQSPSSRHHATHEVRNSSKNQRPQRSVTTESKLMVRSKSSSNREVLSNTNADSSFQRSQLGQRNHLGSRASRVPGPSRLLLSTKITDDQTASRKGSDSSSPTHSPNEQASKLKLAPLYTGLLSPSRTTNTSQLKNHTPRESSSEPVYENSEFIQQHAGNCSTNKQGSTSTSQIPSTQKYLVSNFGASTSRPITGCGPSQTKIKRSKTNIPTPGTFYRPRQMYSGIGAG